MFSVLARRSVSITARALSSNISFTPCRFASFKKISKNNDSTVSPPTQRVVANASASLSPEPAAEQKVPMLNDLLRTLWMKIHPDLMHAYPTQKETNEQSLATLQGILTALKDPSGDSTYPKVTNAVLVFYLRGDQPGHFKKGELLVHTTGSASKLIIQKQLETFFSQIGLAKTFQWDAEYFPFKTEPTKRDPVEEEDSSYSANYNESYEEFQERILRQKKNN